jgi:hypothetical protein
MAKAPDDRPTAVEFASKLRELLDKRSFITSAVRA